MYRFNVIILLACVGTTGVLAGSILKSLDNAEIENLKGKNVLFSDFCLSSRDYFYNQVQQDTVSAASGAMKTGIKSFWEASLVQLKALEKLTAQLKNPSAPIEGLDEDDSVDAVIASGMKKIQASDSYLKSLVYVFSHAVAAYRTHLNKLALTSEADPKLSSDAVLAFASVEGACSKMLEYENEIKKQFAKAKEEIVAKEASLAEVELENVECFTSKRVLNMATVCRFVESAKAPIKDLLGIGEL